MPAQFSDDDLKHFKNNPKLSKYDGTLGSLQSWLRDAYDECERLHNRGEIKRDKLPDSLAEYMTPPKLGGNSPDDWFDELEHDLACVIGMIAKYGESKWVSQIDD